jgi:hypothetical protein
MFTRHHISWICTTCTSCMYFYAKNMETMQASFEDCVLVTVVQVFVAMRNLIDDSWLVAAASAGDDIIGEVQNPILQGKNLRSCLNWFVYAILDLIYDRAMMTPVHYFFFEDVAIGEAGWCYLDGVCTTIPGLFLFFNFSVFLLCAFIMSLGHGCNWYLYDINIYSLLKKIFRKLTFHFSKHHTPRISFLVRCEGEVQKESELMPWQRDHNPRASTLLSVKISSSCVMWGDEQMRFFKNQIDAIAHHLLLGLCPRAYWTLHMWKGVLSLTSSHH